MNRYIIILTLIFFMGACKSPSYLSSPKNFPHQVKGLIFEVKLENSYKMRGEIIEVTEEAIWVLPLNLNEGRLTKIPKEVVQTADIYIATTSNDPKGISSWAGLINFTIVGHGWFGFLTLPLNLAITIPIANDSAKGTYRMNYPKNVSWEYLYKFARFPQGLPAGYQGSQIK